MTAVGSPVGAGVIGTCRAGLALASPFPVAVGAWRTNVTLGSSESSPVNLDKSDFGSVFAVGEGSVFGVYPGDGVIAFGELLSESGPSLIRFEPNSEIIDGEPETVIAVFGGYSVIEGDVTRSN